MPKRKREDSEISETRSSRDNHGSQRKRAEEKLFHAQKLIQRALKVAKGFERQKLGRRQKTAAKDKDEATLKRLDAEIEALKTLDLGITAEAHLHKTLLKDKEISQSPRLPERVTTNTKSGLDTATANVTARLYNSKPVKDAVGEAIPSVRTALGLPAVSRQSRKGGNRVRPDRGAENSKTSRVSKSSTIRAEHTSDDSDGQGDGGDREVRSGEDFSGSEDTGLDDDSDFAALDSRLAAASDDESSFHSQEEDEEQGIQSSSRPTYKPNVDLSLSPTPSRSRSPSPVSKTKAIQKKAASSVPAASKTFLPSLTMGGYVSGSESEAEDLSDADVAPRKNRRGQRARQQIWEKKFGHGAKHLQNEPKGSKKGKEGGRDDGWDPKRGAQQDGAGKGGRYQPAWKKARSNEGRDSTSGFASGGNATQVAPRKQMVDTSNKPLHPSWEAAKKAKEKKMETGGFAGKKVVFD